MKENNMKSFKAKLNASVMINIYKYKEVKESVSLKLNELSKYNGDSYKEPSVFDKTRLLTVGTIIEIGDNIVLNEVGNVTVYPYELFESYNKKNAYLPCLMKGNVTKSFNQSIENMPLEERQSMERKRNKLTSRYNIVPMMEKISD